MLDETTLGDEPPAKQPKYDQEFFLALAARGKEAWNEWRRDPANKEVRVTFAGVDFSESPRDQIDFSGFEFGDKANFSGCNWQGDFIDTSIITDPLAFVPGHACFNGADFGKEASFDGSAFGHFASFEGTTFGERASFFGAIFGWFSTFSRCTFGPLAEFSCATFGVYTEFSGATFGNNVAFAYVTFDDNATFTHAVFTGGVDFIGAAFGRSADFDNTNFKGLVEFIGRTEEQWTKDFEAFVCDERGGLHSAETPA